MSGFLNDDQPVQANPSDKYLKFPNVDVNKKVEIKVRILDEHPVHVWRHWIKTAEGKDRSYNCPGRGNGCPACLVRLEAKDSGNETWRDMYRMDKKYLVNVLVLGSEPEVKVLSFGKALGDAFNTIHEKLAEKGDNIRDWDLAIIKKRTGPLQFNVDYSAIQEERRDLTETEQAVAENRFDLEAIIQPTPVATIEAAINGKVTAEETSELGDDYRDVVEKRLRATDFVLADFPGVESYETLTKEQAAKILGTIS